MILPYSKHSMKDTKPHVRNCLNLCPLDCSQPLYLRTSYVKEKASEASAKHVGVGVGDGVCLSSQVFRFALASSCLAILSTRSTIGQKYEKTGSCEQSVLMLFPSLVHLKMYGFLHQLTLASHSLVKY